MRWAGALTRALVAAGAVTLVMFGADAAAATQPELSTVVVPNIGPGYAVTSQGPLDASQFASASPDPSAAAAALHTLARTVITYERVWQDGTRSNQVQDLVVRCPNAAGATAFLGAVRRGLASGEVVGTTHLAHIAGATRTSYFATTATQVGVGQTITVRDQAYVLVLSVFSAGSNNPAPITQDDAVTIAEAQRAAINRAIHQATTRQARAQAAGPSRHTGGQQGPLGWTLLAAAVVILALLVVAVRQSRRNGAAR